MNILVLDRGIQLRIHNKCLIVLHITHAQFNTIKYASTLLKQGRPKGQTTQVRVLGLNFWVKKRPLKKLIWL